MKPTFLKYFFFPVFFLLIFHGTGKGEVFSGFGREGVKVMVAKNHVKNLPAHNLDMVDLQTARSIAIQTEALSPGKMVELIKAYSIGDPAQVDFTLDMNRIQGFYVKAAIDARSAGKMDDVATFYAALEKVRKYRKLHVGDAVTDLDLFLTDLAANQNLLDFFLNAADDATRLKYAKAWEGCSMSDVVRSNPEKLTKVSRYFDNNPNAEVAFKAEFNATATARRGDFVDRRSTIDDLNKLYNPAGGSPYFAPQGLDASTVPLTVYNEMVAEASAPQFLDAIINSGSSVPNTVPVTGGYTLYKVVPKGSGPPSGVTPFWLKMEELNLHKNSPDFDLKLGLPLDSHSPKYDIYKIELNSGQQANVFESTIANTVEGGYNTSGGAVQSLVLDRNKWSSPELLSDEIFPPAN